MLLLLEERLSASPVWLAPLPLVSPPPRTPRPLLPLCWRGEFWSARSFAHVNREAVLALRRAGAEVSIAPTDQAPEAEALSWEASRALLAAPAGKKPAVQIEFLAEEIPPPPTAPRVVYLVVWESFVLPDAFATAILARQAEVWAASQSAAAACLRAGIPAERVRVIPHGADLACFSPTGEVRALGLSDRFVFLFAGVSHYRKGVDVAVRAFVEEFSPHEPASLVIKDAPASYGWGANLQAELRALADRDPRIVYLVERLPPREMAALYRAADALVAPSRGEGFHLPLLEALACGCPILTTATGVAPDLAGDGVTLLDARPVVFSGNEGENPLAARAWLAPEVSSLRRAMRERYRAGRGRVQRSLASFSWDEVARQMIAALTGRG